MFMHRAWGLAIGKSNDQTRTVFQNQYHKSKVRGADVVSEMKKYIQTENQWWVLGANNRGKLSFQKTGWTTVSSGKVHPAPLSTQLSKAVQTLASSAK